MSNNRRKAGAKNRTVAYVAAGLIHLVVLAALVFNYSAKHEKIEAHQAEEVDTVNASLINEKDIKDQQAKITELEKERQRKKRETEQRERKRLAEIKQQALEQQEKVADLKKQQKIEKEKTEELELQRQAIALKKKKDKEAEDKRKLKEKKEEEKRKAKALAEKKLLKKMEDERASKQKELNRLKREEQEYKERQRLNALLAQEEQEQKRRAAERIAKKRTASIQSLYSSRIQSVVKRFWRIEPGTPSSWKAKMNIKLSSTGKVISVRILESSGSAQFDQSLEAAIAQASPLPIATAEEDIEAHTKLQNLNITFTPY